MPNPQVHFAIGIIGTLAIVGLVSIFYRNRKIIYFIPLVLLLGGFISMVPDLPELAKDYPAFFEKANSEVVYHKPAWNTPIFNICFAHPYLDSKYPETYDTFGLVLTLAVYNTLSLVYFYIAKKKFG
jgi:hypothetical protein